jgi:hypothetical protein
VERGPEDRVSRHHPAGNEQGDSGQTQKHSEHGVISWAGRARTVRRHYWAGA